MRLDTHFAGLDFQNPLMPASGPLVGDDKKIQAIASFGVGGMVTKTISIKGAEVPRPCIYGEKNLIMNAELWSEFPLEQWVEGFLPKVKETLQIPLLISVGYTKEDMEILIPALDAFADGFEVSTHYVGKDLEAIGETVKTIRSHTEKPFFMKMSPHIPDPVAFAEKVMENGGNGVVAINSLGPTMKIDLAKRAVLVGNAQGEVWTSGPVIKPLAQALVHRIKKALPHCTVIGVGGIATAEDVLEFLLAGADGVQMLSAAMLKGKDLYAKIIEGLPGALERYGFESIEQVKAAGLATGNVRWTPQQPVIREETCTLCGRCEKVCPYFAIEVNKQVIVDEAQCFGCGLCQSQCPAKAISGVLETV